MSLPEPSLIRSLIGNLLPGGCTTCNATQEVTELKPNVFIVRVYHEPTCTQRPNQPADEPLA